MSANTKSGRRRIGLATAAALAMMLAACSGSDDAAPELTTSAVPSTEASTDASTEPTTEPSTEPSTEATTEAETDDADADEAEVEIDAVPVRPVPSQVSTESSHWIGVVSMSAAEVEVTWSEVEGDDVVYQLFRFETEPALDKEAVDLEVPYAEVIGELAFVDAAIEPGAFYTYVLRVIADDEVLERRWTDVLAVDDTTPPTQITNLQASITGEGVLLEWDPSSDDVEFGSYGVFRTDGEGEPQYIGGGGDLGQTSFLDDTVYGDGAPQGGVASYEIVAFDFHNNRSTPTVIEISVG